jgi:hypothetical protein
MVNRIARLKDPQTSPSCQEKLAPDEYYFPPPMSKAEATGQKVSCLVFHLSMRRQGKVYVAYSADCECTHGKGDTVALAVQSFKWMVEWIVKDGYGGLFSGQSSEAFQHTYLADLVEGWEEDGITILSVSFHEVVLFT